MLFSPVPSGTPQSLVNTSTNLSNITIQWDRLDCLDRNGDISLYRVKYGPTSSMDTVPMTTDVSTRMFTAIGLAPRMSYTFEVEAFNFNIGPPASISVATSVPESELQNFNILSQRFYFSVLAPSQVLVFFSMVCSMVTTVL